MSDYIWVGLDVHVESISAAILEGDSQEAEVVKLSGDLNKVRRLIRRLSKKGPVCCCYDASGSGFVLHRRLEKDGFHCEVMAPSLLPRKPGDRRKCDRLEAVMLARLYRSGHLTPVHVPDEWHEAVRQLIRLRCSYKWQTKSTKHLIYGVLKVHGYIHREGKPLWMNKHKIWLAKLRRELEGPLHTVLVTDLEHFEYLEMQRSALDGEIERYAQQPPYRGAGTDLIMKRPSTVCRSGSIISIMKNIVAISVQAPPGTARRDRNKVVVAVARELCWFIRAMMKAAPLYRNAA